MRAWIDRPAEEAALLNPAFTSLLMLGSAIGFSGVGDSRLSFGVAHLVLPVLLHEPTRIALPRTTRTSLAAWLAENSEKRIGFCGRLKTLRPHSREAMLFAARLEMVAIHDDGSLSPLIPASRLKAIARSLSGDAAECVRKSMTAGKWLALAGTPATIFALWGVRP